MALVQRPPGPSEPVSLHLAGRCLSVLALCACSALAACGSRSELPDEDPGELGWALPRPYRSLQGCEEARGVPAGWAWVGLAELSAPDGSTAKIEPWQCDDKSSFPDRERWVEGFFLDPDETTEQCFEACVEAGACAPPEVRRGPSFPVQVSRADAEAFCAFRGGRLPQLAELARAEGRETIGVGNPKLFARWLACELRHGTTFWNAAKAADPECRWFAEAARVFWLGATTELSVPDSLPPEVRSEPDDVGPWGHYDLFAGGWERVLTEAMSDEERAAACVAPVYVDRPGYTAEPYPLLYAPPLQIQSAYGFVGADPASGAPLLPTIFEELPEVTERQEMMVFRCAYDP